MNFQSIVSQSSDYLSELNQSVLLVNNDLTNIWFGKAFDNYEKEIEIFKDYLNIIDKHLSLYTNIGSKLVELKSIEDEINRLSMFSNNELEDDKSNLLLNLKEKRAKIRTSIKKHLFFI